MVAAIDGDTWLTAAECARRMRLTVRALRLYERHGLIAPRRTAKNWRLYGATDLARLNEVLALKRLGLSLSRITTLLAGRAVDLERILTMQRAALLQQRDRAERSLVIVSALQGKFAAGARASVDELVQLARETNMTDASSETVAWRRYEQARPRAEAKIDPGLYEDFAGHYQLADGPAMTIAHRDGRLFLRLRGQPECEAFPESDHAFFLKITPAQITFGRDATGRVDRLVVHQDGLDHPAMRIDETTAQNADEALEQRIRSRTPLPDSEARLRSLIAEHQRGEPAYEKMSAPLASLVRERIATIQADLERMGSLQGASFKGVSQDGWDVYDVRFARGEMEWRFALAPDGKFNGLFLRPSP
jgi:DNA-binding transcriptional MerR regulator